MSSPSRPPCFDSFPPNVAVHAELRDLFSRCANGTRHLLGSKRGINASGAAQVAAMLGTPLRARQLAPSLVRSYTRWPACMQHSCWLSPVGERDPACK